MTRSKDRVLVIAPHPDDETFGCGGTLLRHKDEGDEIHWLIVTTMHGLDEFSADRVIGRDREIDHVTGRYGFASSKCLGFPTKRLDTVPVLDIVAGVKGVVDAVEATILYIPFHGDAHSDHRAVCEAVMPCTKWFRSPSLRCVLAYETLSETDQGIDRQCCGFQPNVFVDITRFLDTKIQILGIYATELGQIPFPRSEHAVRALATVRGVASGCEAAEGFMLISEVRRAR